MLEKTPFTTWTLPGLILFSLLGIYPLVVAYSLWRQPGWRWPDAINPWKNRHWSWAAALSTGIIVLTWIIVQMLMLRTIAGLQAAVFDLGLCDPAAGAGGQREEVLREISQFT